MTNNLEYGFVYQDCTYTYKAHYLLNMFEHTTVISRTTLRKRTATQDH